MIEAHQEFHRIKLSLYLSLNHIVRIIKKGSTKEEIQKTLTITTKKKKRFEASKFSGIIKLAEDPLEIQQRLRDEWK